MGRNRQRLLPWLDYTDPGLVTITPSDIGLPATGLCTLLWKGTITSTATGATQAPFVLDDGSVANYYQTRQPAATNALQAIRVTASAGATATLISTLPAGVEFACGMSIDGNGNATATYGGTVVNLTGGPTSGMTRLRFNVSLTGSATRFRILPAVALSESDLINAVGGL
jgi:hypothetical protein